MIRKIIQIDEKLCNGCGICANACHEGAIGIVDGKAVLLRDDYCDGLGDCLPTCPTKAISFVEREAADYNHEAVQANMLRKMQESIQKHGIQLPGGGCPGSRSRSITRSASQPETPIKAAAEQTGTPQSQLTNWPVQIKLAPVHAPYFQEAKLLIAADCSAYAYANMHEEFIKGHVTLIGCPKLDDIDYSEKLTQILQNNTIKSVTVVRMEVPCCGGLSQAVITALKNSQAMIPWQIVTISIDGKILDRT